VVNRTSRRPPARPQLEWPDDRPPRIVDAVPAGQVARATLASIACAAIELLGTGLRRREPQAALVPGAVCGNRARVARHYARRAEGG
jgi:hypothetical protein